MNKGYGTGCKCRKLAGTCEDQGAQVTVLVGDDDSTIIKKCEKPGTDFLGGGGCGGVRTPPEYLLTPPPRVVLHHPQKFFPAPPPKDTINGQIFSLFNNLFNTIRKYTGHRIIHNFFLSSFDLSETYQAHIPC